MALIGAHITYILQKEQRTGPCSYDSQGLPGNEDFVMFLGDNLIQGGVKALVDEFESCETEASILLRKYRIQAVWSGHLDEQNHVVNLIEKPKEPQVILRW